MNKIKKSIAALVLVTSTFVSANSYAFVSPVGLAILAPVQFPTSEFTVAGARFSAIWGSHREVYGLDFGAIGNMTEGRFIGLGVSGLFNLTHGDTTILGLQLAGGANVNMQKTNVYGLQVALGVNMNQAESAVNGVQLAGLANIANFTAIRGAQIGIYNRARAVYGLQIGLVNVATSLHGIQIGIINFHQQGMVSVSPIINIGF